MVDLHDALRPTGTTPPPPAGEIADRARRRRRRRHAAASGALAATIVVAVVALGSLLDRSADAPTVADGVAEGIADGTSARPVDQPRGSTTVSAPTTGSSTDPTPPAGAAPSPAPSTRVTGAPTSSATEPPRPDPDPTAATTTAGLLTASERTSEWSGGYCFQMQVTNEGERLDAWQVVADLGGTIATLWNATAEPIGDRAVFAGIGGYNAGLDAGERTSFGACVDVVPEP